ncbi:MAG: hypothetical protein ABIV39_05855, partial [Verrucomicrobiota bacterium]
VKHEVVRILEAPTPPKSLTIVLNPRLRAYVEQNYRDALHKLEEKYGVEIGVAMNEAFHVENYAIERIATADWKMSPAPAMAQN